jgi:hypothetical protein
MLDIVEMQQSANRPELAYSAMQLRSGVDMVMSAKVLLKRCLARAVTEPKWHALVFYATVQQCLLLGSEHETPVYYGALTNAKCHSAVDV